MRYQSLIRKLIQASWEARNQNKDIADTLKARCINGIDIIRQTLMNCVCDPRFRMHVGVIPQWNKMAQEWLEKLASELESTSNLTEELAMYKMDIMLSEWFEWFINYAESNEAEIDYVTFDRDDPQKRIQKALEEYVNGKPEEKEEESQEIEWSGEEPEDPLGYLNALMEGEKQDEESAQSEDEGDSIPMASEEDKNESLKEQKDKNLQNELEDIKSNWQNLDKGRGRAMEQRQVIENRFMSHVPPTLIELAKRIGRSSQQHDEPSGKFMSASKSDIAGITTGNDLSCMLPSELALMASPQTENIFYKNYITRGLQLFASMSHTQKSKNHQDGPIIICLDTSSSMSGEPILVATALTFAVCIIAQRRKRKIVVVRYSDTYTPFFLKNINAQRRELQNFLSHVDMGGNNEDMVFNWMFTDLLPNQGDYQSADILCISDFGWGPISQPTMELIREEKKKDLVIYGLNIGDGENGKGFLSMLNNELMDEMENTEWVSPEKVCDSLWEYQNGVCKQVQ